MTSPLSASPYEVLGVPVHAGEDELRRAYRLRLRHSHPDTGGTSAEFIRVKRAWELLGTPEARAAYDDAAARSSAAWAPRRARAAGSGGAAARRGGDTRPAGRSIGTPGGRRRALYLECARALGVDEAAAYSPAFVGAAPREVRRLLADALAEEATAAVLERMGIGFTAWHSVTVGDDVALDHVVMAPSGLIALASEDFGSPVRVRRGELIGGGVGGRTPAADLLGCALAVARGTRARFGGALLILPDDAVPDPVTPLGPVRGVPTAVVRRSVLRSVLRRGVPGARVVGGPEMLETRARLLSTLKVWEPAA